MSSNLQWPSNASAAASGSIHPRASLDVRPGGSFSASGSPPVHRSVGNRPSGDYAPDTVSSSLASVSFRESDGFRLTCAESIRSLGAASSTAPIAASPPEDGRSALAIAALALPPGCPAALMLPDDLEESLLSTAQPASNAFELVERHLIRQSKHLLRDRLQPQPEQHALSGAETELSQLQLAAERRLGQLFGRLLKSLVPREEDPVDSRPTSADSDPEGLFRPFQRDSRRGPQDQWRSELDIDDPAEYNELDAFVDSLDKHPLLRGASVRTKRTRNVGLNTVADSNPLSVVYPALVDDIQRLSASVQELLQDVFEDAVLVVRRSFEETARAGAMQQAYASVLSRKTRRLEEMRKIAVDARLGMKEVESRVAVEKVRVRRRNELLDDIRKTLLQEIINLKERIAANAAARSTQQHALQTLLSGPGTVKGISLSAVVPFEAEDIRLLDLSRLLEEVFETTGHLADLRSDSATEGKRSLENATLTRENNVLRKEVGKLHAEVTELQAKLAAAAQLHLLEQELEDSRLHIHGLSDELEQLKVALTEEQRAKHQLETHMHAAMEESARLESLSVSQKFEESQLRMRFSLQKKQVETERDEIKEDLLAMRLENRRLLEMEPVWIHVSVQPELSFLPTTFQAWTDTFDLCDTASLAAGTEPVETQSVFVQTEVEQPHVEFAESIVDEDSEQQEETSSLDTARRSESDVESTPRLLQPVLKKPVRDAVVMTEAAIFSPRVLERTVPSTPKLAVPVASVPVSAAASAVTSASGAGSRSSVTAEPQPAVLSQGQTPRSPDRLTLQEMLDGVREKLRREVEAEYDLRMQIREKMMRESDAEFKTSLHQQIVDAERKLTAVEKQNRQLIEEISSLRDVVDSGAVSGGGVGARRGPQNLVVQLPSSKPEIEGRADDSAVEDASDPVVAAGSAAVAEEEELVGSVMDDAPPSDTVLRLRAREIETTLNAMSRTVAAIDVSSSPKAVRHRKTRSSTMTPTNTSSKRSPKLGRDSVGHSRSSSRTSATTSARFGASSPPSTSVATSPTHGSGSRTSPQPPQGSPAVPAGDISFGGTQVVHTVRPESSEAQSQLRRFSRVEASAFSPPTRNVGGPFDALEAMGVQQEIGAGDPSSALPPLDSSRTPSPGAVALANGSSPADRTVSAGIRLPLSVSPSAHPAARSGLAAMPALPAREPRQAQATSMPSVAAVDAAAPAPFGGSNLLVGRDIRQRKAASSVEEAWEPPRLPDLSGHASDGGTAAEPQMADAGSGGTMPAVFSRLYDRALTVMKKIEQKREQLRLLREAAYLQIFHTDDRPADSSGQNIFVPLQHARYPRAAKFFYDTRHRSGERSRHASPDGPRGPMAGGTADLPAAAPSQRRSPEQLVVAAGGGSPPRRRPEEARQREDMSSGPAVPGAVGDGTLPYDYVPSAMAGLSGPDGRFIAGHRKLAAVLSANAKQMRRPTNSLDKLRLHPSRLVELNAGEQSGKRQLRMVRRRAASPLIGSSSPDRDRERSRDRDHHGQSPNTASDSEHPAAHSPDPETRSESSFLDAADDEDGGGDGGRDARRMHSEGVGLVARRKEVLPADFLFSGKAVRLPADLAAIYPGSAASPDDGRRAGTTQLPPIGSGLSPAGKTGLAGAGSGGLSSGSTKAELLSYTPPAFSVRVLARSELSKLAQHARIDYESLGYRRVFGNLFMKKDGTHG